MTYWRAIGWTLWLIAITIALGLLAWQSMQASAFDPVTFERFMGHAAHFERVYFGCPDDSRYTSECTGQGTLDYKLQQEVWREGREVFGK